MPSFDSLTTPRLADSAIAAFEMEAKRLRALRVQLDRETYGAAYVDARDVQAARRRFRLVHGGDDA